MKKWLILLLVVVLAFGISGCKKSSSQVKWTIGMSQCNLGEPWRVQMNEDLATAAANHSEIKVIYKDAQNDSTIQRSQMEEFISQKVDLIIISPLESAPLTKVVEQAYVAGIPVIVLDRRVDTDQYTCFIGADNFKIGELAGKWIVEKLNGKGKVVELKGLMTSTPAEGRNSGFRKAIEGTEIEVIFEADMKWLEDKARSEMESALARFDKIDLVYAHNDPGAHGAFKAAEAAKREKDMLFVGIDGLATEGKMYVKQGILNATFYYPTCAKEAIETALKILNGEKVEKEINPPTYVIDKDTLK